jgi:23S rRNA pseudouridine1911/1915/1917 synthase
LIGDKIYGRKRTGAAPRAGNDSVLEVFPRQALHAEKLAIDHVRTGERMEFHAPLATDMEALLNTLRQSNAGTAALSVELSRRRG